eukprot:10147075-Lingulodinium_polyedra.AAC.1
MVGDPARRSCAWLGGRGPGCRPPPRCCAGTLTRPSATPASTSSGPCRTRCDAAEPRSFGGSPANSA